MCWEASSSSSGFNTFGKMEPTPKHRRRHWHLLSTIVGHLDSEKRQGQECDYRICQPTTSLMGLLRHCNVFLMMPVAILSVYGSLCICLVTVDSLFVSELSWIPLVHDANMGVIVTNQACLSHLEESGLAAFRILLTVCLPTERMCIPTVCRDVSETDLNRSSRWVRTIAFYGDHRGQQTDTTVAVANLDHCLQNK